jgi:AmiR/NasT family two-component response regulator
MRRTEEALRQARDQLELRVVERTAELEKSVAELREKERQRLLLESEKFALETEKSVLSDKLETRKIVDRAKGIVQRDLRISEEEAYRTLQRESQQRRRSMRDIAESIILNDDLKRK